MIRPLVPRARKTAEIARARRASLAQGVTIGAGTGIGPGVRVRVARGGRLHVGRDVYLDEGVVIAVSSGAELNIGDGCFAGHHVTLAAHQQIDLGDGCFLAEMVSIRDHDHVVGLPPRTGGLVASPVAVGADTWVGAKASILRGSRVGDGAVIGAHAVVRGNVPPRTLAAGVPARIVRHVEPLDSQS